VERSFLLPFDSAAAAMKARDCILNGALQPAAIDVLNPAAAETLGKRSWLLAVRAVGNAAAAARYERELAPLAAGLAFEDEAQESLWRYIQEFTLEFLARHPGGAVVRVSCTLKETEAVMEQFAGPAVARSGSGVCYGYWENAEEAGRWIADAVARGWKAVIEFSPEERKRQLDLWPAQGCDFALMQRVKKLFDPGNVLNRGRLYGRI
jgi:FAD/FMN-containing dehydrogenase